jgi:hypothetical protein
MASEEMIQAINKHLTGDTEEFMELRERFEGCDSFQPHAAAALGYLIAKDELEAAKEKEEEPDVYDQVIAIINRFDNQRVNSLSPHSATDQIFTLIYEWLDDELVERGYGNYPSYTRDCIKLLFQSFVIEKPEA